ncbi:xylulokinase [Mycolicibacterium baixiangningiae]|uniref:xylulokinase n=1 Tax=Mycolicibacterium baixiangningiae TaxID=2761578 RepID=UPI0018E62D08|nr:FGGY family carbohydrate kinase [Mycolicibacterium baixiangningiae]
MTTAVSLDFGTSSLKVAVTDTKRGLLGEADRDYAIRQPFPAWAEQDPAELWELAGEACREALADSAIALDEVDAVVIVAPWKAVIPVSVDGDVLCDGIIWLDGRASEEAVTVSERYGINPIGGQAYWPRLLWLRSHRPDVWHQAAWLMGLPTYLRWRATGQVVTDPSDNFFRNPERPLSGFGQRLAHDFGFGADTQKFAPVRPCMDVIGELTEAAASHLGLLPGTRVINGFGDLPAVTLGATGFSENAAHIYFGTSSWLTVVTREGRDLDAPLSFTFDDSVSGAVFPMQTGMRAYNWITDQVYKDLTSPGTPDYYAEINRQVAEISAGSENLLATHWLVGELPPLAKSAKGVFINLTARHDRRHMVRAVMESLCYTHRQYIERLSGQHGLEFTEVVVVGGGALNEVLMQMLADVIQRDVVVPNGARHAGTRGAHLCAEYTIAGAGEPVPFPTRIEPRRFRPDPSKAREYDRMYQLHLKIFPALRSLFAELNQTEGP